MSTSSSAASSSTDASARSSDADCAWVHARVAELGGDAGPVHAAPLAAGPDGRIVLSTDAAASAMAARAGADATAHFAAGAIRVGAGETLVVRAPDGRAVTLTVGALEVADGGRVVLEAGVELHARRARFGADGPIVLVGADGGPGAPGAGGGPGSSGRGPGGPGGGGGPGTRGGNGEPGPGGSFFFEELAGVLTIVAGGGSGGRGGPGGAGGRGGDGRGIGFKAAEGPGGRYPGGSGGAGGAGGQGGDGGDGGLVVVAYRTVAEGAAIQPVAHVADGGAGGPGGGGGPPGDGDPAGGYGQNGANGPTGASGAATRFLVRPRR